jgi:hypothetical protein
MHLSEVMQILNEKTKKLLRIYIVLLKNFLGAFLIR